jgi:hypothetical protein
VGPEGVPLMVLLALMAATLLAGTLWLWPILARRRLAFVVLRIALLVGLQVSVLGAIFIWVNRSNEFYTSWSDLLGTDHSTGAVVAARPGLPPHAPAVHQPPPLAVLASRRVALAGAPPDAGGRLEKVRFAGPVSGIRATGHVYLPPGYATCPRPRSQSW